MAKDIKKNKMTFFPMHLMYDVALLAGHRFYYTMAVNCRMFANYLRQNYSLVNGAKSEFVTITYQIIYPTDPFIASIAKVAGRVTYNRPNPNFQPNEQPTFIALVSRENAIKSGYMTYSTTDLEKNRILFSVEFEKNSKTFSRCRNLHYDSYGDYGKILLALNTYAVDLALRMLSESK